MDEFFKYSKGILNASGTTTPSAQTGFTNNPQLTSNIASAISGNPQAIANIASDPKALVDYLVDYNTFGVLFGKGAVTDAFSASGVSPDFFRKIPNGCFFWIIPQDIGSLGSH